MRINQGDESNEQAAKNRADPLWDARFLEEVVGAVEASREDETGTASDQAENQIQAEFPVRNHREVGKNELGDIAVEVSADGRGGDRRDQNRCERCQPEIRDD